MEYIDVVGTTTVLPPVSKTQITTLAVTLERSARIDAVATETLETRLYRLRQYCYSRDIRERKHTSMVFDNR